MTEDTQVFSAVPVFSYIQYFKHRMPDELLYAAHIKIPKSGIFKVHLSLKGDIGLTGRPGPVGPPGVGEPGFMVCLVFYLVIGKQDRKQKFSMLPHKNGEDLAHKKMCAKLYHLFSFFYHFSLLHILCCLTLVSLNKLKMFPIS